MSRTETTPVVGATVIYGPARPGPGLDGALRTLASEPFGPVLLISVALGPIAFGLPALVPYVAPPAAAADGTAGTSRAMAARSAALPEIHLSRNGSRMVGNTRGTSSVWSQSHRVFPE